MGTSDLKLNAIDNLEQDFACAASNQYFFDCLYYEFFNKSLCDFHGLPRPAKWLGRNPSIVAVIKYTSLFLSYAWAYVLFYCHLFYKVVTSLYVKRKSEKNVLLHGVVFLAVCEHSCNTIFNSPVSTKFCTWLLPQNIEVPSKYKCTPGIDFVKAIDVIDFSDIWGVLKKSITIHQLIIDKSGPDMSWQTYSVFDWVVMYAALLKLKPSLILTAEHHDRWAVMADRFSSRMQRLNRECAITIVQHGKEHSSTYENFLGQTREKGLPYKLKNVKKLFVYNDEQREIFLGNIIDANAIADDFEVLNYDRPSLKLTDVDGGVMSILFVGHPFCEQFQMLLCERLCKVLKANVYYKPHPAAKPSPKVFNASWNVIADDYFYPRVNFVISYPSTLVDEYEVHRIKAFVHPLKAELSTSDCYSASLLREIVG
ncbi:hypothetical protein PQU95_06920 [Vogesella sp. DC21W]|uniref:Uncharacterized protein n=1 Tax=Vogesella aquatica TaxID=2984206 RepID=A0ABT5IZA8_9NEIS|nr:hypothetical protein [Vogesella aquatica]MDC7716944.1 hypothetical protein [Vogesella aquatica]